MDRRSKEGLKTFQTTEDDLHELFGKYGEIREIMLPKCKDKRYKDSCAGFAFVQFARQGSANAVKSNIDLLKLKNRKLTADFAINKDMYVSQKVEGETERKMMQEKLSKILLGNKEGRNSRKPLRVDRSKKFKVKREDVESGEDLEQSNVGVDDDMKTEVESYDGDDLKEETGDFDEDDDISDDDEESDDDDDSKGDVNMKTESDDEDDVKHAKKAEKSDKKKAEANGKEKNNKVWKEDVAVTEGRVVFLRNVNFGATNEMLKEAAEKFGPVSLAILCKYPDTDQPSGTAFVHFVEKSAADAFLNQILRPEGVAINNRQVYGHRAVPRTNVAEFKKDAGKVVKDKRNLYLLRASLIREGTSQARGMSEHDIALRKRLIAAAKVKLKDLTMFVSPTRLAIHNIPHTFTDQKLMAVCKAPLKNKSARITECRIMREKVGVDAKGHALLGKSKGFGFVAFEDHADALDCLKSLNNHVDVFTQERRPIVEFSIESLIALRIREQRLAASRNPKENGNNSSGSGAMLKDPAVLAETKRQLMAGGRKWLPKRLGAKVRARDEKRKPFSEKPKNGGSAGGLKKKGGGVEKKMASGGRKGGGTAKQKATKNRV